MLDDARRLLYTEPRVVEAEFSSDSRRVVGADLRGNVSTWTARDQRDSTRMDSASSLKQVAFSPFYLISSLLYFSLLIPLSTLPLFPFSHTFPISSISPSSLSSIPSLSPLFFLSLFFFIYLLFYLSL